MSDELEILLKSYDYLRQEIFNSIGWQNRIFIAAATIISVLLGLGLTEKEMLRLSVIIIPPAVIAFTAFWLVEQSRMMRAGDYLQLLEDEINTKIGGAYILWENWLRRGGISWRDIHKIHHISQYLGSVVVFYTMSGISALENHYSFPFAMLGMGTIYRYVAFSACAHLLGHST